MAGVEQHVQRQSIQRAILAISAVLVVGIVLVVLCIASIDSVSESEAEVAFAHAATATDGDGPASEPVPPDDNTQSHPDADPQEGPETQGPSPADDENRLLASRHYYTMRYEREQQSHSQTLAGPVSRFELKVMDALHRGYMKARGGWLFSRLQYSVAVPVIFVTVLVVKEKVLSDELEPSDGPQADSCVLALWMGLVPLVGYVVYMVYVHLSLCYEESTHGLASPVGTLFDRYGTYRLYHAAGHAHPQGLFYLLSVINSSIIMRLAWWVLMTRRQGSEKEEPQRLEQDPPGLHQVSWQCSLLRVFVWALGWVCLRNLFALDETTNGTMFVVSVLLIIIMEWPGKEKEGGSSQVPAEREKKERDVLVRAESDKEKEGESSRVPAEKEERGVPVGAGSSKEDHDQGLAQRLSSHFSRFILSIQGRLKRVLEMLREGAAYVCSRLPFRQHVCLSGCLVVLLIMGMTDFALNQATLLHRCLQVLLRDFGAPFSLWLASYWVHILWGGWENMADVEIPLLDIRPKFAHMPIILSNIISNPMLYCVGNATSTLLLDSVRVIAHARPPGTVARILKDLEKTAYGQRHYFSLAMNPHVDVQVKPSLNGLSSYTAHIAKSIDTWIADQLFYLIHFRFAFPHYEKYYRCILPVLYAGLGLLAYGLGYRQEHAPQSLWTWCMEWWAQRAGLSFPSEMRTRRDSPISAPRIPARFLITQRSKRALFVFWSLCMLGSAVAFQHIILQCLLFYDDPAIAYSSDDPYGPGRIFYSKLTGLSVFLSSLIGYIGAGESSISALLSPWRDPSFRNNQPLSVILQWSFVSLFYRRSIINYTEGWLRSYNQLRICVAYRASTLAPERPQCRYPYLYPQKETYPDYSSEVDMGGVGLLWKLAWLSGYFSLAACIAFVGQFVLQHIFHSFYRKVMKRYRHEAFYLQKVAISYSFLILSSVLFAIIYPLTTSLDPIIEPTFDAARPTAGRPLLMFPLLKQRYKNPILKVVFHVINGWLYLPTYVWSYFRYDLNISLAQHTAFDLIYMQNTLKPRKISYMHGQFSRTTFREEEEEAMDKEKKKAVGKEETKTLQIYPPWCNFFLLHVVLFCYLPLALRLAPLVIRCTSLSFFSPSSG